MDVKCFDLLFVRGGGNHASGSRTGQGITS